MSKPQPQKQQIAEYEMYKRISLLGEGAYGKAYLVECLSDPNPIKKRCVIKQMNLAGMTDQEKREATKEAKILESLKHPNIIKFLEVYKTKKGKLCIVMDYAEGGDLGTKIKTQSKIKKNFAENQILDWFTQLCLAMKHVHDRKIIHRDLKTQNIFLTKANHIKLGDFGIAKVLSSTREKLKTIIGTPYYLSPEIIENKPYSFKSDIWSIGVVLYEMCALKPPFTADSIHYLALKIVRGQYPPIPNIYSKDLRNLVQSLLHINPNNRPSIQQILKMPVIVNRIQNFLSESQRQTEFCHTIFHNQNMVDFKAKFSDIQLVNQENPPPLNVQKQIQQQQQLQQQKQQQLKEKSQPQKQDQNQQQQQVQKQQQIDKIQSQTKDIQQNNYHYQYDKEQRPYSQQQKKHSEPILPKQHPFMSPEEIQQQQQLQLQKEKQERADKFIKKFEKNEKKKQLFGNMDQEEIQYQKQQIIIAQKKKKFQCNQALEDFFPNKQNINPALKKNSNIQLSSQKKQQQGKNVQEKALKVRDQLIQREEQRKQKEQERKQEREKMKQDLLIKKKQIKEQQSNGAVNLIKWVGPIQPSILENNPIQSKELNTIIKSMQQQARKEQQTDYEYYKENIEICCKDLIDFLYEKHDIDQSLINDIKIAAYEITRIIIRIYTADDNEPIATPKLLSHQFQEIQKKIQQINHQKFKELMKIFLEALSEVTETIQYLKDEEQSSEIIYQIKSQYFYDFQEIFKNTIEKRILPLQQQPQQQIQQQQQQQQKIKIQRAKSEKIDQEKKNPAIKWEDLQNIYEIPLKEIKVQQQDQNLKIEQFVPNLQESQRIESEELEQNQINEELQNILNDVKNANEKVSELQQLNIDQQQNIFDYNSQDISEINYQSPEIAEEFKQQQDQPDEYQQERDDYFEESTQDSNQNANNKQIQDNIQIDDENNSVYYLSNQDKIEDLRNFLYQQLGEKMFNSVYNFAKSIYNNNEELDQMDKSISSYKQFFPNLSDLQIQKYLPLMCTLLTIENINQE